jgi:hypothetical protein
VNLAKTRLCGNYTESMIEPVDQDLPIGRRARRIQLLIQALKKLTVWGLEIGAEALGTCLIIVGIAFMEFRHEVPPLHNDLSLSKVVGISLFILIEFASTGYLVTTLISRFLFRGGLRRWYPYVCAGLFLIHSTIFLVVGAGNVLFREDDLAIQLAGACLTLACAWTGNQLVAHWIGTSVPEFN